MNQALHMVINQLSRTQTIAILENHGFACYDSESTDDLEEALRSNIEDGTIDESAVLSI
jgi:hypothetical protein